MIGILIAAIVALFAIVIVLGVSVFILFKHVDRNKYVKSCFGEGFAPYTPLHSKEGYDVKEIHRVLRREKL